MADTFLKTDATLTTPAANYTNIGFKSGDGKPYMKTSAGTETQIITRTDTMVGDSGAGGTAGLVPAPAAGDAAATKFLKADGTWAVTVATSMAFSGLSSGTNTTAAMVVGNGASIAASGTGTIVATGVANNAIVTASITDANVTAAKLASDAIDNSICEGRLTLTSGSYVADTGSAQSSVYFTPYNGNRIALYDGSRWNLRTFTEAGVTALTTTGVATASRPYDIFAYDDAGTVTLEFSAAYSSDTARTDALTTQNGVLVKSGATTRRYLGTVYLDASKTCSDTANARNCANYYNRLARTLYCSDTSVSSFDRTGTGYELWNASIGATVGSNVINFTVAQHSATETVVDYSFYASGKHSASNAVFIGIGLDSNTTLSGNCNNNGTAALAINAMTAKFQGRPAYGYHSLSLLAYSNGATSTFYTYAAGIRIAGAHGTIWS